MFSDDNEYHKNKFARNGAGAAVMFSKRVKMTENTFQDNWGPASYGLLLKELYDSELTGNTFYRNTIGINGENCTRMKYKISSVRTVGEFVSEEGAIRTISGIIIS